MSELKPGSTIRFRYNRGLHAGMVRIVNVEKIDNMRDLVVGRDLSLSQAPYRSFRRHYMENVVLV